MTTLEQCLGEMLKTVRQIGDEIDRLDRLRTRTRRITVSSRVPLTRVEADTGAVVPVLYWKVDDAIVIHPDRWVLFWRVNGVDPAPKMGEYLIGKPNEYPIGGQ